jgi:quercetin dioxygenase-like cupin family protein
MRRLILFLFLTALLTAQAAPEVEISAEPHHHLVFANDQVGVFNVDVAPHSETLWHRHGHDYFYVMFGSSEIVNAVQGKDPVNVKLHDAQVGFTPGVFVHVVRNLDQPFRNVTIELLQDDKLRQSSPKWDEVRGLEILNGGTQEILFVKDGVRASEIELQPGGMMPGVEHAGPMLLIALSEIGRLSEGPKNHVRMAIDQQDVAGRSGDTVWLLQGRRHGWFNAGNKPAKFVTLEFP